SPLFYPLSLHDALPISLQPSDFCLLHPSDKLTNLFVCRVRRSGSPRRRRSRDAARGRVEALHQRGEAFEVERLRAVRERAFGARSEEHTSELQSQSNLV